MKRDYSKIIGTVKGYLTVDHFGVDMEGSKKRTFLYCNCECGGKRKISYKDFCNIKTPSCGCFGTGKNIKDGRKNRPEYNVYRNMIKRCYVESTPAYKDYGARGITVCESWKNDFANFLKDMGSRPEGLTIERINVNGNYEPSNCKWATWAEQSINKRTSKKNLALTHP